MKKYIVSAVLSLGILVTPAFTQAAGLTSSQINAIIGLLQSFGADQSVINNVQISLNGSTPAGTRQSFCHNFNSDLTRGSSGNDVVALNRALTASGIDTTGNSSNFDENNAGDVVAFQSHYGIRQTGYVGPITRAKLNAMYGCYSGTTSKITINNLQINPANPNVNVAAILSFDINKDVGKHIDNEWAIVILGPQGVKTTNQTSSCVVVGAGERCSVKYDITFAQTGQQGINVYVTPVGASQDSSNATSASLSVAVGATSTVPSITVLSPNGGEVWQQGTQVTIRWNASNIGSGLVGINLQKDGVGFQTLGEAPIPNTGSYVWTVPSGFAGLNFLGSNFKIRILNNYDPTAVDESDAPFTIAKNQNDAIIQDNLSRLRFEAEIYYGAIGNYNSYTGVCTSPTVTKTLNNVQVANGGIVPSCNASATAYAVSSPLMSGDYWCVDSLGSSRESATILGVRTSCL